MEKEKQILPPRSGIPDHSERQCVLAPELPLKVVQLKTDVPFPQTVAKKMKEDHPAMYRYCQTQCEISMNRINAYEEKKINHDEDDDIYDKTLQKSTEFWSNT